MIYEMPWQGRWLVFTDEQLAAIKSNPDPAKAKLAEWFLYQFHDVYKKNPLSQFLAHSGGLDFINDWASNVSILWAGNQQGKSAALIAKAALRAIPNNPDWHCFKHNKIVPLKWNGPVRIAINTYEWMHHKRNLWPAICKFLPLDELREYHPDWNGPMSRRKRKEPAWNQTPTCKLSCGTIIDFYCCRQPPECFESVPYDFWANDEQQTEQIFDAQWSRGSSKKQFQIGIACTPHKVQGRSDTGAGGFIARMYKGIETKGLSIGRHIINVDEVPDVVMPPKTRAENYHKYITYPMQTGNQKAIREGRSRWFGEPESSEGLVYDNWLPQIHFIEPFEIPTHWTRVRSIDPGRVAPTAVLWGAMSPWGDLILYREYYEAGLGISDNAKRIVEASGNQLREVGRSRDSNNNEIAEYEEIFTKEEYLFSVMDGRTFKQPSNETGTTLGYVWARAGIRCIPASGMRNSEAIPIVKEWLEIRPERQHILIRMQKADKIIGAGGVPIVGAPRMYAFSTLRHFRKEIECYSNKEDNPDEPADRQEDHLMTAVKYLILAEPRYAGPIDPAYQKKSWHLDSPLPQRGKRRYEYHL